MHSFTPNDPIPQDEPNPTRGRWEPETIGFNWNGAPLCLPCAAQLCEMNPEHADDFAPLFGERPPCSNCETGELTDDEAQTLGEALAGHPLTAAFLASLDF